MMMKLALPVIALSVVAAACGVAPKKLTAPATKPANQPVDQALLATFKRAVPSKESVLAKLPESVGGSGALVGDPAQYPQIAVPHVVLVNNIIATILDSVGNITKTPPTLFDSSTQTFLWGPFDNSDSPLVGDKALVFIKDNGLGQDFRYSFAFARLMGDDVSTAVPVIYGAVNPDPAVDNSGNGVLLLDLEASRNFTATNGGDVSSEGRGRFATAFFHSPDANIPGNVNTVVVGSFRGFTGTDGTATADVDHLWGHVDGADGNHLDFINLNIEGDVIKTTSAEETLDMELVMFNGGVGRGEVILTGGDAGTNTGDGIECWNAAVEQQFYQVTVTDASGTSNVVDSSGDASGCVAPFNQPLANLGLPTLQNVPANLLGALQSAAENGIAAN